MVSAMLKHRSASIIYRRGISYVHSFMILHKESHKQIVEHLLVEVVRRIFTATTPINECSVKLVGLSAKEVG